MDTHVVLPPLFATQQELLYFAGRVPRQGTELHGSRTFEVRKMFAAEGDDFLLASALPSAGNAACTQRCPLLSTLPPRPHNLSTDTPEEIT